MTEQQQHPITPPPELVEQWATEYWGDPRKRTLGDGRSGQYIATKAAQWGWQQRDATVPQELQERADQELDACCEWLAQETPEPYINALRAARRPKPPSLKEEALNDFDLLMSELDGAGNYSNCADRIRRALASIKEGHND